MEMDARGVSKCEWLFHEELERTAEYLSNHKKILGFNPFCHRVEDTNIENVYRWHFRVSDPQNNPLNVIFFVEQIDELLVELPEHIECTDPDLLTDEMIRQYTVGKRIRWKHFPVKEKIADPAKYLFEGKAFADLEMHRVNRKTRVRFDLKIDVRFVLYPAFRIMPNRILRSMTNSAMSLIMQTATNRMFNGISKDFKKIQNL
ncbi:MAG: DUF1997 domain-containing protein [Chlorobiaceae bacterium]